MLPVTHHGHYSVATTLSVPQGRRAPVLRREARLQDTGTPGISEGCSGCCHTVGALKEGVPVIREDAACQSCPGLITATYECVLTVLSDT
jgi:hypothetical protein